MREAPPKVTRSMPAPSPDQNSPGLRRIRKQGVNLSGTDKSGIYAYVFLPVQLNMLKGNLHQITNRVHPTGPNDVILGVVLLQHKPHGFDIVSRISPISLRVKIAKL